MQKHPHLALDPVTTILALVIVPKPVENTVFV